MHGWRDDIGAAALGESKPENLRYIMFAHTEASQAKGQEFLGRSLERRQGRDRRRATPPARRSTARSSNGASQTTAPCSG
jgi:hypothetical protein